MSQHRKGFFGQVRSPHHAELSLLLLSIIVTIVIEILEKSERNPREILQKILEKTQRNPREILEKILEKSQRNPREILDRSQRNPREILEESQRNLGSLCNVKIKKSLSESVSESVTRSPIELFWTAKKQNQFSSKLSTLK